MEPFKNLLGPEAVDALARSLSRALPSVDRRAFRATALQGLDALELKARAEHLAACLDAVLPPQFDRVARILESMLGPPASEPPLQWSATEDGLAGWVVWPLTMVIAQRGAAHPPRALAALREMTQRFTSEFAVRPFLRDHPKETLAIFAEWTRDPSPHVRRLVSEGSRPRLPWGMRLEAFVKDPSPTLPLLEALRDDPSPYVRKSVANHLNDVSKDHPERFADLLERWLVRAPESRKKLLAHASRSLVKAGHPRVLRAFGAHQELRGDATFSVRPRRIELGDALALTLTLVSRAKTAQKLVVDYVVHHVRANGERTPKVFKGWKLELLPGETRVLTRKHAVRAITTRRYYPGRHEVECRVNGRAVGAGFFVLDVP